MKRTFNHIAFTAILLLTLGVGSSFSAPAYQGMTFSTPAFNPDGDEINASFHKDFKQAELMEILNGKGYARLTFKMNGMILIAYYSDNGELLAVTHNILSTQLPLTLMLQLRNDYSGYWISDLFEYDANGSSCYYITLENANTRLTLRSNTGNWETYSKTSKD
jgi:hypothetical protein